MFWIFYVADNHQFSASIGTNIIHATDIVLKDSAKKFELEICANIIPHLILSFFILYTSSGRYFAIFGVILITPAAPVVICTKYEPAKWPSTYFLKMRILRHCFRISTARNRFYDVYHYL